MVTRLKYPQKIRVSAYNGETLTPFSRSAFAHKGEEREKGNAVGSLTGLCTPIAREVISEQDNKDSEQNLHKVFSREQWRLKALKEEEGGDTYKHEVEGVVLRSQARHLRAEDQQQHSSNRQFGQSRGDLEALHSSGEQLQSAQRITSRCTPCERGTSLNTIRTSTFCMWFIRLVKLKNPPSKAQREEVDRKRAEAEKWGVKFHETFFTLGRYDLVSIIEAPDEKTALRYSISTGAYGPSETLVAVSRDEVTKWTK